jgi:hypothetical protein
MPGSPGTPFGKPNMLGARQKTAPDRRHMRFCEGLNALPAAATGRRQKPAFSRRLRKS